MPASACLEDPVELSIDILSKAMEISGIEDDVPPVEQAKEHAMSPVLKTRLKPLEALSTLWSKFSQKESNVALQFGGLDQGKIWFIRRKERGGTTEEESICF